MLIIMPRIRVRVRKLYTLEHDSSMRHRFQKMGQNAALRAGGKGRATGRSVPAMEARTRRGDAKAPMPKEQCKASSRGVEVGSPTLFYKASSLPHLHPGG